MCATRSEYQVEYCGMKSKSKGGGGSGGAGGEGGPEGLTPCKYNEDIQPVGGRVQAKYRDQINEQREELKNSMTGGRAPADCPEPGQANPDPDDEYFPLGLSVYDEDYTNEMNISKARWLKPAGGEAAREPYIPPPFQPDLYMFRSSEIKAPNLPFVPQSMRQ